MASACAPMPRLAFIDGIRGIAALVVAVGHTWGMVGPDHPIGSIFQADGEHLALWPWLFGKQMVWLFIMVSGFALLWSEQGRLASGRQLTTPLEFARRRAWRILPTYYLSLALGGVAVLAFGWFLVSPSPSLETYEPTTWGGLISHLILIQNLSPEWIYQFNPPLWSIAVEAQLYLVFPLLVWMTRRIPTYAAAVTLLGVAFLANKLVSFPVLTLLEWFLLGAVLAHFARRYNANKAALFTLAGLSGAVGLLRLPQLSGLVAEAIWMLAFSALILALVRTSENRANITTWRITQWIGKRSYSLYAVHFPIALLVWAVVARLGLDRGWEVVLTIAAGISISLLAAHACYQIVELPSLRRSRETATPPAHVRATFL